MPRGHIFQENSKAFAILKLQSQFRPRGQNCEFAIQNRPQIAIGFD